MKLHSGFVWWHSTASAWFTRMRGGSVPSRVAAKFRRWLSADPANQLEYAKRELAWELTGELENDPQIADWLAEAQAPARTSHRARFVWATASALCTTAAVLIAYFLWPAHWDEYATQIGERRTVVLSDESRIDLNTDTLIRISYGRQARTVVLERGEATFRVARNPSRPFEVWSQQGVARALGTEFNVMSLADGVTVTVLSGKVEVLATRAQTNAQRHDGVILSAGQEVSYRDTALSQLHAADTQRVKAWQSGRVAFENMPLAEAMAEFNRYMSRPIVIKDRTLDHIHVSGVFRIGETDALLKALNTAFGIEATEGSRAIELQSGDRDSTSQ
jgi:transmembrane sensor